MVGDKWFENCSLKMIGRRFCSFNKNKYVALEFLSLYQLYHSDIGFIRIQITLQLFKIFQFFSFPMFIRREIQLEILLDRRIFLFNLLYPILVFLLDVNRYRNKL